MVNETSAVPSFYTSEFYEKANEVLLLEYGIQKEDISSEISEEVYLCLIQNIVIDNWLLKISKTIQICINFELD